MGLQFYEMVIHKRFGHPQEMDEEDKEDLEEELAVVEELDHGVLVNNGELLLAEALAARWDLANMGCIWEMTQDLPSGCWDNYFALTRIVWGKRFYAIMQVLPIWILNRGMNLVWYVMKRNANGWNEACKIYIFIRVQLQKERKKKA